MSVDEQAGAATPSSERAAAAEGTPVAKEGQQKPETVASVAGATGRLIAMDVARGLAVLGMYIAHVGPNPGDDDPASNWLIAFYGRSSILFAVLAGVSLALMSGRTRPVSGRRQVDVTIRITVRAVLVSALGVALIVLTQPLMMILVYYGLFFLLAIPFLRLRAKALAWLAVGTALLGPVVSFLWRAQVWPLDPPGEARAFEVASFNSLTGLSDTLPALLVTGAFPAITWMPFVFAGMAIGRIDWTPVRNQYRLLATGAALVVAGYGGSRLLLDGFGFRGRLDEDIARAAESLGWSTDAIIGSARLYTAGKVPTSDYTWLMTSSPHSGTTFEILGGIGVAFVVIALCLLIARWVRPLLAPIASVGALALTAYAGHHLVLAFVGRPEDDWTAMWWFLIGAVALCWLYRLLIRRGPFEAVLTYAGKATSWALLRGPVDRAARG
ncbi:putative membrane protein YeiB [Tamaricihabitans halophyticus]|uniref:Putative membrane protein YeiB n=1 Tax=Tamaricihabitans halophyticus TaxID=1262583 RepID=A0A4R2QJ17_9PSEU|nr:heparan-alpha-glucosaminide N-acetyltransferase domain-containing protein [Tamaricihabitans halophyticus]TCP49247.1 putative membrane protein YeiB [Tamaricihabitans halophyticus]